MAQIVELERAERLARAILSDILLYHEAELRDASPKLAGAVQEGRELFRGRVAPALHEVFERLLAESRLGAWASATTELDGYRSPPPMPLAPPEPQSSGLGVPLLLGLVVFAVATYFFFR